MRTDTPIANTNPFPTADAVAAVASAFEMLAAHHPEEIVRMSAPAITRRGRHICTRHTRWYLLATQPVNWAADRRDSEIRTHP